MLKKLLCEPLLAIFNSAAGCDSCFINVNFVVHRFDGTSIDSQCSSEGFWSLGVINAFCLYYDLFSFRKIINNGYFNCIDTTQCQLH